ncbi:MAG: hypothetical protein ACTSP9_12555 [Promethearchaeota archaeon]
MMMKSKPKIQILSLVLLGIIFFGVVFSAVSASQNYQLTLTKSTDEYTINQYNDASWKATVNPSSNPTEWFEGEANVTEAKSKQTIKGWVDTIYTTYDAFISLYLSIFEFVMWNFYNQNFTDAGYNETEINTKYPNTYNAWFGISAEWWFTDGVFDENPNNTINSIIIFKNSSDYKSLLDNCNALMGEILNDTAIDMSIKFLFSNKTADEFMWQMVFYGFAIADPQVGYLDEVITELGCENTTAIGNTLIFEKTGVTDYSVEISYGSKGTMSTFVVKDNSDVIIYQITSSNTDWIFFTILISIVAITVVTIVFVFIRNRKLKK